MLEDRFGDLIGEEVGLYSLYYKFRPMFRDVLFE